jgi:hypothetical protein
LDQGSFIYKKDQGSFIYVLPLKYIKIGFSVICSWSFLGITNFRNNWIQVFKSYHQVNMVDVLSMQERI